MRVTVLGGTRFIGRAVVCGLVEAGHDLLLVHRGEHEPDGFPDVRHLHANRRDLADHRDQLAEFETEAVIDVSAMTGEDAAVALDCFEGQVRLLAVSSIDVYRAFGSLWADAVTDAVPLDEHSPVRTESSPDREVRRDGWDFDHARYEKLDVERAYLARGGTVVRLPFVYGEHDYQRREQPILSRVRSGDATIEIGAGNWLGSRGYVGEIATGICAAITSPDVAGEVLNLCEWPCASVRTWIEQIVDAAGWQGELVQVADDEVAADLELSTAIGQHLLVTPAKAERLLGWRHRSPGECVARSVAWHMNNPPE